MFLLVAAAETVRWALLRALGALVLSPCRLDTVSLSLVPHPGRILRQVELLLAGGCSGEEPFVGIGTWSQEQHPGGQVHIQASTRSPPQKVKSHLCDSWTSSVCTGGRVQSCLD